MSFLPFFAITVFLSGNFLYLTVYIIAYFLNSKNIHNFVETDLDIMNRFIAYHISIQSEKKNLGIQKQFHNFKLHLNGFVFSISF